MSRWSWAAAGIPGAALVVAALAGWVPHARDVPAYFVPLRHHTARVLAGQASPFWLDQVGCGEPFFANPQSAMLYPPAWLALLLPPEVAVGVEVGLHLALLGVGAALLARRLGAAGWWPVAAGLGAVGAGPVMDSAGVLNNLTALTWLPWAWEAALAGAVRRCAAVSALPFFAGEPQIAAVGGAVSLLLAPSRRTGGSLLLAAGITAIQAVPFAFWVAGGDRGAAMGVEEAARGALTPSLLPALAFPGAGGVGPEFGFVIHPTVPAWALLGVALALSQAGPVRRLAVAVLVCIGAAALAGTVAGGELWTAATLGLVRYPARLLMPAAVMAAAAGAAALNRAAWRGSAGCALALALGGAGLLVGATFPAAAPQALAAGLAGVAPWGPWTAAAGSLALAGVHAPALELRGVERHPLPCAIEQRAAARIYVVEPSRAMFSWIAGDFLPRTAALGLGYHALQDGREMARSFAPLANADLAAHLSEADRGPAGRWWLDALGADVVVSLQPIPAFPVRCAEGGVVVSANPRAWPLVAVVEGVPAAGASLVVAGDVLRHDVRRSYHRWAVRVDADRGVVLRLDAADSGWRYRVDGERVQTQRGPGILRGIPVRRGDHVVEARYRPPGIVAGAALTLVTLAGMASCGTRKRREERTERRCHAL